MSDLHDRPAHLLHTLVARLDDAAEAFLQDAFGISYARYLLLVTVDRLGSPTQRELAAAQGVSEPATSRMVSALVASGHLVSTSTPGGGNRRSVGLTAVGEDLLTRATHLLEDAFASLTRAAGVDPDEVGATCARLLATLDGGAS